jgi:Ca2+-binding RTX toxin-like protein
LYSTGAGDQTVTNTSYVGLGHATLRSIERLSLGSGSGNDRIDASRWTIRGPVSLDGGAGDDTIIGSPQADSLSGEDGKDVLRGGGGNDQLQPDASPVPDDDTIAGGPGRDQLNALIYNSGNIKYGKASVGGLDTFTSIESVVAYPNYTFGGPLNFDSSTFTGDVSVQGTALADVIETGSGDDRFTSGNGADSFAAHGGNDEMSVLLAGGGSVNVSASAVNSTSAGIKSISGVNHVDVYGDATAQSFGSSAFPGTVRFNGVGGNDVVNGNGPGTTYELDGAAGPVVITNGGISATGSTIGFTNVGGVIVSLVAPGTIDAHAFGGKAQLYGTTGVDTLTGTDHADRLAGFAGDDTLKGQAGDDILWGSSGQDVFRGGPGQDRCDNKASEDATSCEGKAPPLPT